MTRRTVDPRVPGDLTQHPLAEPPEGHVGLFEGRLELGVDGIVSAFEAVGVAVVQDPLRGPLHHHKVAVVLGVVLLVYRHLQVWAQGS